MKPEERLKLITRNTQEIVTEKELNDLLKKKKKPSVYLGTAPTGRPHVGYFLWFIKMGDFLKAGLNVKLLLADLHAALDNTPWEVLEQRYKYYDQVIRLAFKSIGVDTKNFETIKGSSFQLNKDYISDLFKLASYTSINDCKRAGAEVVKFGKNPKLSGLIYPLMQALDEEYLKVDIQYGGVDQRKILMLARERLPSLGYNPRIELMTPIIPGLQGVKMSASDFKSKIDLLDSPEDVKAKLNKAHCPAGETKDNGVLAFLQYVVFVLKEDNNAHFIVERPEKFGGDLKYTTYKDLEKDYIAKKLHPLDLKNALAKEINILLDPIRKGFKNNDLIKKAYPEDL
jgi:tyrosyl-tRNA synthetase